MNNKRNTNTEIYKKESFSSLANMETLSEALEDDCRGLEFSFDRVNFPVGGDTMFELPSPESEDPEIAEDITGVIVYNHPAFSYYQDTYAGGHNLPDCESFDGIQGIGTPGGECAKCLYNRFGSGVGQSKMCKNKRMLYILRENELLPITLSLPIGSLKTFTNYVKSLLRKGRKLSQVVTRITLKKAVNSSGITYSQAVFLCIRKLDEGEISSATKATEAIKAYTANLTHEVSSEDASLAGNENMEEIESL